MLLHACHQQENSELNQPVPTDVLWATLKATALEKIQMGIQFNSVVYSKEFVMQPEVSQMWPEGAMFWEEKAT